MCRICGAVYLEELLSWDLGWQIAEMCAFFNHGEHESQDEYIFVQLCHCFFLRYRAPSRYPRGRLSVGSRRVSGPQGLYLELSDRSGIWQALQQQCCWCACQVSEWYDNLGYQSRGFGTLRDLAGGGVFSDVETGPRWKSGSIWWTSNHYEKRISGRYLCGRFIFMWLRRGTSMACRTVRYVCAIAYLCGLITWDSGWLISVIWVFFWFIYNEQE